MGQATEKTQTLVRKPIRVVVTSDRMNKSRVAVSERKVKHPLVGKYMLRRTKYMFHDEENQTNIGDEVLIKPCRPMSARKKYQLVSVVKKSKKYETIDVG